MIVALLGAGKMGSFHAATLRQLVDELRIYDADPSRSSVSTLEEALRGADAAVIATPAASHVALIHECINRGLDVFCEKPVALALSEAQAVLSHVESAGARVQMGFQRRSDAAFAAARERVREGAMGRVLAFSMATFDRTPPPRAYLPTSGGLFRDMHIHDFDTVRWLFGQEVAEVNATGGVLVDPMFAEYDDVDTSALSLRLEGGTLGVLVGARANPAGYLARLDVYGSEDMLAVREEHAYLDFLDRYAVAYRAEIAHFLRVVGGEAEVLCTVQDGLEALRIATAADLSRREGRTVKLAEIGPPD